MRESKPVPSGTPQSATQHVKTGQLGPDEIVGMGPDKMLPTGRPSPQPIGPGLTGIPQVDRKGICEGKNDGQCFLSSDQRKTLSGLFAARVSEVSGCFRAALSTLAMEKRFQKEELLPWYASLALDVVSMKLTSVIASALQGARSKGLASMEKLMTEASMRQDFDHWSYAANESLFNVSSQQLTANVKMVVDTAKVAAKGIAPEPSSAKTESISYLAKLQRVAANGFQSVREQTPVVASDAEMLVLFDAFDITNHPQDRYEALLREKLQRYMSSGVTNIGRTQATHYRKNDGYKILPGTEAVRDTRVVWHTYVSGFPKQLFLEHVDGPLGGGSRNIDLLLDAEKSPRRFGPYDPFKPETGVMVPEEFVEDALERHQQMWGTPVATVEVDDSASSDPSRAVLAQMHKRRDSKVMENKPAERHTLAPPPNGFFLPGATAGGTGSQAMQPPVQVPPQLVLKPEPTP